MLNFINPVGRMSTSNEVILLKISMNHTKTICKKRINEK